MEDIAYCSSDTTELAQALMKVHRNLQPVAKDATNTYIGNRYATLNTVMDACRDLLLENNIWMIQYLVPTPASGGTGALGLVTKLTHVTLGQWQCTVPHYNGMEVTSSLKEKLWDKYSTVAPARRRQSVGQSRIVKRA